MSGEELGEMAAAWASNRRQNAIGALNEFVSFCLLTKTRAGSN
jgi:hypothetical protein